MKLISQYSKSILAGLIAGLSSAEAALQSNQAFHASQWIACVLAGLVAFAGVSAIPNKQKE